MQNPPAGPRGRAVATLTLRNPSDYPRRGPVSVPWKPIHDRTGIPPGSLVLTDQHGTELAAQVDPVDPSDPSRARLVFLPYREVEPGAEDYSRACGSVSVHLGTPAALPGLQPWVDVEPTGFNLRNGVLDVYVSYGADQGRPYFAGAANSVQLHGLDVLDGISSYNGWENHEPEKRCMQVDRLCLARPAWLGGPPYQYVYLADQPYDLVHTSQGPVRATATIASPPFHYDYGDPVSGRTGRMVCRFFRVLSVYHAGNCVADELYVRAVPEHGEPGARGTDLVFSARYFAFMNMGLGNRRRMTHHEHIPDWFTISLSQEPPLHGYSFATDVHAKPIATPHPGFPAKKPHLSYSWELGAGRGASCLHLFQCGPHQDQVDNAGRAWYNHVYKPLLATLDP